MQRISQRIDRAKRNLIDEFRKRGDWSMEAVLALNLAYAKCGSSLLPERGGVHTNTPRS